MTELERYVRRGWEVVRLTSPELVVEVVPDLGATVCSIRRRSDGLEVLHQSPWGLPRYGGAQLGGSADVLRHEADPGGWQSVFPNGGDSVVVSGADQGFDGEARIASFEPDGPASAATDTDTDTGTDTGTGTGTESADPDAPGPDAVIRLSTRLRRSPITMIKIISVRADTVSVTETVRNDGGRDHEVMWGSRLRFGAPLISTDAEIDAAAALVHPDATILYDVDYDDVTPWPRTPGPSSMINLRYLPEPGSDNRLAYLDEFAHGSASITNPTVDCRVRVSWDSEVWPYLWYALEAGDTDEFPWYGAGYFLTLTPSSSWPAHGLDDARRISSSTLWLEAGQQRSSTLSLQVGSAG